MRRNGAKLNRCNTFAQDKFDGGLKVYERENPKLIRNSEFFPVNCVAALAAAALLLNILEFRWISHQIFNHRIPKSFKRILLFRT